MSFLGGSSAPTGASQTQAIKQQVAQEAAVANARQLVEVPIPLHHLSTFKIAHTLTLPVRTSETQRTLLRTLHPQARLFAVVGRIDLLLSVHGKIHVGLECRVQAIHQSHTERGWCWRQRPNDVNMPAIISRPTQDPSQEREKKTEREGRGGQICMIYA